MRNPCFQTIVDMQPEKVVYVSCDSATLARDVKFLRANGYELKDVTPVDPRFRMQCVWKSCVVYIG